MIQYGVWVMGFWKGRKSNIKVMDATRLCYYSDGRRREEQTASGMALHQIVTVDGLGFWLGLEGLMSSSAMNVTMDLSMNDISSHFQPVVLSSIFVDISNNLSTSMQFAKPPGDDSGL